MYLGRLSGLTHLEWLVNEEDDEDYNEDDDEENEYDYYNEPNEHRTFVPTAEQAVMVLNWIGENGRLPD